MKHIDLTTDLQKNGKVIQMTMYRNRRYFGFAEGIRESGIGICFVRLEKKGLVTHKNGTPKWFFGMSPSLTKAIANVRSRYNLKLGHAGWDKFRVKFYSHTDTAELVQTLNEKL